MRMLICVYLLNAKVKVSLWNLFKLIAQTTDTFLIVYFSLCDSMFIFSMSYLSNLALPPHPSFVTNWTAHTSSSANLLFTDRTAPSKVTSRQWWLAITAKFVFILCYSPSSWSLYHHMLFTNSLPQATAASILLLGIIVVCICSLWFVITGGCFIVFYSYCLINGQVVPINFSIVVRK